MPGYHNGSGALEAEAPSESSFDSDASPDPVGRCALSPDELFDEDIDIEGGDRIPDIVPGVLVDVMPDVEPPVDQSEDDAYFEVLRYPGMEMGRLYLEVAEHAAIDRRTPPRHLEAEENVYAEFDAFLVEDRIPDAEMMDVDPGPGQSGTNTVDEGNSIPEELDPTGIGNDEGNSSGGGGGGGAVNDEAHRFTGFTGDDLRQAVIRFQRRQRRWFEARPPCIDWCSSTKSTIFKQLGPSLSSSFQRDLQAYRDAISEISKNAPLPFEEDLITDYDFSNANFENRKAVLEWFRTILGRRNKNEKDADSGASKNPIDESSDVLSDYLYLSQGIGSLLSRKFVASFRKSRMLAVANNAAAAKARWDPNNTDFQRTKRKPQFLELTEDLTTNAMCRVNELMLGGKWKKLPIHRPSREKKPYLQRNEFFIQEMQFLNREQTLTMRWQLTMARKRAQGAAAFVKAKQQSKDKVKESETEIAMKACARVAKLIDDFWAKQGELFDGFVQYRIDAVMKKRLESELLSVIDRSSALTELMIPGLEVSRADGDGDDEDDDEDVGELLTEPEAIGDVDSYEELLHNLPPEYLASLGITLSSDVSKPPVEDTSLPPAKQTALERSPLRTTNGKRGSRSPTKILSTTSGPSSPASSKVLEENGICEESKMLSEETTIVKEPARAVSSDSGVEANKKNDDEVNDLVNVAQSFQPTGNTYDTANVRTIVPKLLTCTLREYQHIGLDWLVSLYANRLNGILADEMGLGKTVQTIAFVAYLAEMEQNWGPHLIVVPTSVLLNWEREFKRFCPSLQILTYYGSTKERAEKRKGWKRANAFNVCITSYDLYIRDTRMFKWRAWQALILDEAHNIKNSKSLRWNKLLSLRSRFRLLLTGTPLQNNLMELWSLLYFLMPSVFGSQDDFKNWFSDPMSAMAEGSAEYNTRIVKKLHTVLRPFILRRLKAEVEKQMPQKVEKVVYCPLARIQRNMYNQFIRQKSTIDSIKGGSAVSVMNIVMQLRKCCNHPNLFLPSVFRSPYTAPRLSIHFPSLIVDDPIEVQEARRFLRIMKADIPDYEDEDLALYPSETVTCNEEYFIRAPKPEVPVELQIPRRFAVSVVKTKFSDDEEKITTRLRNLWRLTLPIRQALVAEHEGNEEDDVFEAVAARTHAIARKEVFHSVFSAPFAIAELPSSNVAERPTEADEVLCDIACEVEEPLASTVYASTFIEQPNASLVELDCGKLRTLAKLLAQLYSTGHRCLIFTQMSKMLDILETFLSYHKYTYFRLDGSTGIQKRQILMDRSGGIGMNLTGADTVIFYDSDWNPTMDAQAQDRCHRIGQTRDVTIYRLISTHTIEENILKKAHHKRRLGEMALDEGSFTPGFSDVTNVRELFDGEDALRDVLDGCALPNVDSTDLEKVMLRVEDAADAAAALEVNKELGGVSERLSPDDFMTAVISELSPIEILAFNSYRAEREDEIEARIMAAEAAADAELAKQNSKASADVKKSTAAVKKSTPASAKREMPSKALPRRNVFPQMTFAEESQLMTPGRSRRRTSRVAEGRTAKRARFLSP